MVCTKIMGILNTTPDSFFDGGQYATLDQAISRGLEMIEQGADILDIGGESTRPGSLSISVDEEIARTIPVIQALRKKSTIPISIDTSKAAVARAAIDSGANFINDVTAMHDPEMISLAIQTDVDICIMHMQGSPLMMQQNPLYCKGVTEEILTWFQNKIEDLQNQGVKKERIILDPGIGFGKSIADNLKIIHNLPLFKALGFPLLLGLSRKSFMQKILSKPAADMLPATLGMNTLAIIAGVEIIRVHDIKEHRLLVDLLTEYKQL